VYIQHNTLRAILIDLQTILILNVPYAGDSQKKSLTFSPFSMLLKKIVTAMCGLNKVGKE